jgi:hypothetical protein
LGQALGLCGQWHRSRLGECGSEPGEDRQVGMEPDPLKSPDTERQQRPLVLEASILALDRTALAVELLPPVRPPRDQGVESAGRDPLAGRGAFAGWAAPLGRLPLGVRAGEGPLAMLADWRQVLAGLDGGSLAERDDGVAVARLESLVA